MQAKIIQTLLFLFVALLVVFSGSELPGPSVERSKRPQENSPKAQQAMSANSGRPLLSIPSSYAQERRFEDYWGKDSEWDSKDQKREGYFNIFLKTGNPYIKAGVFVALTVILYLAAWAIFKSFITKYKSPTKTFVYSFLGFLLFVYVSAFICFSEYAMTQIYEEKEIYLFQLNWMIVLISFAVWAIFSLLLTYMMKGKA